MKRIVKSAFVFAIAAVTGFTSAQEHRLTKYVNPFIGTAPNPLPKVGPGAFSGNVFPGAVYPDGMFAWSPDTPRSIKSKGGYSYDDTTIMQFSLTHFSGRGVTYLMDVPFMPVSGPITVSPGSDWSALSESFSHANESAAPGYYRVKLNNGILTELTATSRTGMGRFSFPSASVAGIVVRADGYISVHGNEVNGYHNTKIGGGSRPFKLYFVAQFDKPFQSSSTWNGGLISSSSEQAGDSCGAILSFGSAPDCVVQVRTGISFVSIENARLNLRAENAGLAFDAIKAKADSTWNSVLSLIQVSGGSHQNLTIFYTALYHCFLHPNILEDVNGQYPGMDEKIHTVISGHHQYQNISSWDIYRTLIPLLAIIAPEKSSDVCQSLVNYALQDAAVRPHGGGFPRWEQVNRNSGGMIGDGDDIIIAFSHAFGAAQFDTTRALEIMDKGASTPGLTSDGFAVRSKLREYLVLGYVPASERASVSKTLEYCNDDFALAQYARALGDQRKSDLYGRRAQNWRNLFDGSTRCLRPRNDDGTWVPDFSSSTKKGAYTEGTPAQYVWMVNFNFRELIDSLGGNNAAIVRLDTFFTQLNAGYNSVYSYIGNETDFEVPWVYDFAHAPWRTQKIVRRIQTEVFTTEPGGLAGNDDGGALSSWYVFSALGFYPVIPGTDVLVLGSPLFQKAVVHRSRSDLIILGNGAADHAPYIQRLSVIGKAWDKPWLRFSEIANGGSLQFDLSAVPNTAWGSSEENAPPSFSFRRQAREK
jgi:predicted alpha-1,2-mannosidase